jgi:hypothetical protein
MRIFQKERTRFNLAGAESVEGMCRCPAIYTFSFNATFHYPTRATAGPELHQPHSNSCLQTAAMVPAPQYNLLG